MLRLAVTGGVATGKSTVLVALAERGVPVIDLDRLCRDLVEPGRPELEGIRAEFGEEFAPGGRLDRARLRGLITAEPKARRRLEAILHPPALAEMERRLSALAQAGHRLAAVEVALLYEAGLAQRFDAVIVAACPRQTALVRLRERSGLSAEEAEGLIDAQQPVEDKAARADYVVDTSVSVEEVGRQVERILRRLRAS
jgi:dephospho-CoA kinase